MGIGVAMAQQLTGINSIMYYGQVVLIESGFEESAALIANIAPGVVAVIGGFIALYMMDRVDRRLTFIIGLTLTTTCHILIGVASVIFPVGSAARPYVILALVVAFVLSMQTFLNVAVWVYLAEIFPLHMRGLGIGISVFFGWTTNALLALFFPTLIDSVGITGAFFLFAAVGALALAFVATQVPETRGISLEVLEEDVSTGIVGIVPAMLAGIAIGLTVGFVNGLIIARLNINSFISTLAVGSVITGFTLVLTNASPAQGDIGFLTALAFGRVLGVPWLFIVFIAFALLTHLMLRRTKLGHWIFATGANRTASYLSGVPTNLVRVWAFTFGGFAVAVGAIMLLSQSAVGQPNAGASWPLNAIAICVIGGTSLSGGVGRVPNVVAAALILGVVSNSLNQLGISPYWQPAVSGFVILIAVIVDQITTRRRA